MFTVHFNKVRQIDKVRQNASNVLSFELLPKQSIDTEIIAPTLPYPYP